MSKKKPVKLYSLTDEHRAQLKPWADKWIANNLNTARYTDADKAACTQAIKDLYKAADLAEPDAVVFVRSPIEGAIVYGIAASLLHTQGGLVEAATRAATEAATRAATWTATRAATWAATEAATTAATRAATTAATWTATTAATRAATTAATRAATEAATEAATWTATA
jgi:hypothetical protein